MTEAIRHSKPDVIIPCSHLCRVLPLQKSLQFSLSCILDDSHKVGHVGTYCNGFLCKHSVYQFLRILLEQYCSATNVSSLMYTHLCHWYVVKHTYNVQIGLSVLLYFLIILFFRCTNWQSACMAAVVNSESFFCLLCVGKLRFEKERQEADQ